MEKLTVRPKKAYGQHFLTSKEICSRIIAFAGVQPSDTVLEIGPGTGALTQILSRVAKQTLAIEIDRELCDRLKEEFQDATSVVVICSDFLALDLAGLTKRYTRASKLMKVLGNLPYNLGTPIIEKLLDHKDSFSDLTLMVQREVAERLLANPNSKEYGYITAVVRYHAEVTLGFHLSRHWFYPQPKVQSSVIKLTMRRNPEPQVKDYDPYVRLLKVAFAHRRKTIFNNLKIVPEFSDRLLKNLQDCRIDPTRRAESLSVADFVSLSNRFYTHSRQHQRRFN